MSTIDIRQVRMFVTVADTLSFTKASHKLNVAQPWLSVQIRKLEEHIGFQLLTRSRNKSVVLTSQGQEFLPVARQYVDAANKAAETAKDILNQQALRIRIGAPNFSGVIPGRRALLDRFVERYPKLDLEIINEWSLKLLQSVLDHEIDMAFTVGPIDHHGCRVLEIAHYRWALLMEAQQTREFGDYLTLEKLRGRQLACFRRNLNPVFHDSLAAIMSDYQIDLVPITEPSTTGIHQHAERSCVPVLVTEWYKPAGSDKDLVVIPIAQPELTFPMHLVCRADDDRRTLRNLWNCAQAFVDEKVDKKTLSSVA